MSLVADSEVRVRRMRWGDVEQVLPTERELFADDPWSEAGFWSELAGVPESRHYVVAERAGEVVGYAGLREVQREADVQTVAVAAAAQGAGTGRVLMAALLGEARRRRCSQVMLEVRHDNEPAHRLYADLGFERVAVRRSYYGPGVDADVLRLRLAP